MDTKEKVLEYLGLSKIGRKCPTDKKVSEFMPVLVEKANGDRTMPLPSGGRKSKDMR